MRRNHSFMPRICDFSRVSSNKKAIPAGPIVEVHIVKILEDYGTHQHACTSWRFDLVSSWRLGHPSGSRQDNYGTLVPLRRKAVGGSTARSRTRDKSYRHEM